MNIPFTLLCFLIIVHLDGYQAINVAVNKSASHLSSLNYAGFNWTADKAVDGCLLRDDPDTQQCCSCSEGAGTDNFWRVDLGQQYTVNDIVIYGRQPADGEAQLSGFQVFVVSQISGPEVMVYDNVGIEYGDGVFNFTVDRPVISVVVKRPSGNILTLCEVQVFDDTVTSTQTTQSSFEGRNSGASVFASTYLMMIIVMFDVLEDFLL